MGRVLTVEAWGLSVDPQHPHKKSGMEACTCHTGSKKEGQRGPGDSFVMDSIQLVSDSVRNLVSKIIN